VGAVCVAVALAVVAVAGPWQPLEPGSGPWLVATMALHAPMFAIVAFLVAGLLERVGYFFRGRRPRGSGRLPAVVPKVCVQLPMFNEHEVARRVIETACALQWPRDRLEIQVLDDSTDPDTRRHVDLICREMRERGVDCRLLQREQRDGYKAGALEVGRLATDADLLAIFDADFVPRADFLVQAVPHFFDDTGRWVEDLALVQTQWGHLNQDESALTRAQSLWVDDHHTVQMSWRSAKWDFVNFTGTAGVWRASAVEVAGGWRAASLVEDCELSFRHLFAGYRTAFVKEIVAPAELPATFTAYKAQQRRWTQGWVQLQRLHLRTLLTEYRTPPLRKLHLLYHMCISWQWALWASWLTVLPFLIVTGLWFGALGTTVGVLAYLTPSTVWLLTATVIASVETRHSYATPSSWRVLLSRFARVVPYTVINTGMLPHQFSAFTEGAFGPLHSEFERTPKAATVTASGSGSSAPTPTAPPSAPRRAVVKVHRPYVAAEACFVVYQLCWALLFASRGLWPCAVGALFLASCVAGLAWFYGDHVGQRLVVLRAPTWGRR
jgi:cellulose synthase/poly-beta-1,6-N-acetylglucosamine synthase-like glycosyltransferase